MLKIWLKRKSLIFFSASRVTRLGDFSPLSQGVLLWEGFLKIAEVAHFLATF
jgi:hypothetical protein